jgi:hypothetical protein
LLTTTLSYLQISKINIFSINFPLCSSFTKEKRKCRRGGWAWRKVTEVKH